MKKLSIICLTGMMFFAACENTGSSTVGTYEKDEETKSTEKEYDTAKAPTESNTTDTLRSSMNAAAGEDRKGTTVTTDTTDKMNVKP